MSSMSGFQDLQPEDDNGGNAVIFIITLIILF